MKVLAVEETSQNCTGLIDLMLYTVISKERSRWAIRKTSWTGDQTLGLDRW